jgi:hypothetical protein
MASVISIEFGLFYPTWDAGQHGAFSNMCNIIDLIHFLNLINNNRLAIIAIGI